MADMSVQDKYKLRNSSLSGGHRPSMDEEEFSKVIITQQSTLSDSTGLNAQALRKMPNSSISGRHFTADVFPVTEALLRRLTRYGSITKKVAARKALRTMTKHPYAILNLVFAMEVEKLRGKLKKRYLVKRQMILSGGMIQMTRQERDVIRRRLDGAE